MAANIESNSMPVSADSGLIKRPNKQENYTPEEMVEIARCTDPITGPEYFLSNYYYVQSKGKEKYQPYEFQKGLIKSYHLYNKSISMLPRQSGKCLRKGAIIQIKSPEGVIYDIPIGVFHEFQAAVQSGRDFDISDFIKK